MPGPLTAVSRETKPRILLVDDDPVVLELSATLLRHAGYDVDTAADGEGGWAALTTSHYDLLLTDHNMPRLTGLELAERIRASGSLIPIVIASGSLTRDDLETALRPLVNVVLSKPVGSNLLLETVALLLKASPAPAPVHP